MDDIVKAASLDQLRAAVVPKTFPQCTCLLVFLIFICHTLVLYGSYQTASAIGMIGISAGGWSDVAIDLSRSLDSELGETMVNLTTMLTDSINHTMYVQDMLDVVTGLIGHSADAMVSQNATKAMLLLQMHGMVDSTKVPDDLPGMITSSMHSVLDMLMAKIMKGLHTLMERLRPALLQVGELITKFGDRITTMLEHFSVTLDRVQKIFDQVMSQISVRSSNQEELVHETFNIFDVSNSGAVTAQDLKNTGQIYSIPALQGSVSDDLVRTYDSDRSGHLNHHEFKLMVTDPAIPHSMSVVLRSFAKSLSQVAGQVSGSHFRGEIASNVADYLELMAQKNMTKVSWISDALTNSSLPLEFTSDIIVNLALKVDDPNSLPVVVTGQVVLTEMMRLHPKRTSQAIDLLSNCTYWVAEGFSPSDHAEVIHRVTSWVTQPQRPGGEGAASVQILGHEGALKLLEQQDLEDTSTMVMERRLVSAMPAVAHKLATERMRQHVTAWEENRRLKYDELFSTETSQLLLLHLMAGEVASQHDSVTSPARQMVNGGVPAHPETVKFAKWLSWNASSTADRLQKLSFASEKTSSNTIDGFATQIQGMVKKVHGVIKMMEQYSTPDGISALETSVEGYAKHAATDVLKVIEDRIGHVVNESAPTLEAGLNNAIQSSGMALGKQFARALAHPLGEVFAPSIANVLQGMVGNRSATKLGGDLGKIMSGKMMSGEISNITGDLLGKQIVHILQGLVNKGLASSTHNSLQKLQPLSFLTMPAAKVLDPSSSASLSPADRALCDDLEKELGGAVREAQAALKLGVERRRKEGIAAAELSKGRSAQALDNKVHENNMISGVWEQMVQTLRSLTNVIPQANKALTSARKEIHMLAKNMDSVFTTFLHSGPPIFDIVDREWRMFFTFYYCVMIAFSLALLFYAFWAGGFLNGPGLPEDRARQSTTLEQKYLGCCAGCFYCLSGCHDSPAKSQLCFWSVCILMQIVVLFLFLTSLGFSLFTGIKMFLASGCHQIYLLGDHSICGTSLMNIRQFLNTFTPGVAEEDFSSRCLDKNLLTCNLIGERMKASGLITVIFSFLAALFTFMLLVESAAMHERAVNRTKIEQRLEQTLTAADPTKEADSG